MSKKIKKTNKDEYDFDQLWVELNQTQSISYLVRAKVEQNLSLILSNISAAFTGNRTLANQNTTDIKYNLLEVFNSLDKSDLSKKEIEDYKKIIEYKFLQNANNLNLLMQEISDEMKKANQKMIKISEKIMIANQGVIDFNKSMINETSQLIENQSERVKDANKNKEEIKLSSDEILKFNNPIIDKLYKLSDSLTKEEQKINKAKTDIVQRREVIFKNREGILNTRKFIKSFFLD